MTNHVPFKPDSILGQIIAGSVVFVLGYAGTWLFGEIVKAKPSPVSYLVGIATMGLAATMIIRPWRSAVWGSLRRAWGWFLAIRPVTRRMRIALSASGYERRSLEVTAERTGVPEPRWRIEAQDTLGHRNLQFLENTGQRVWDVTLTCDPEYFSLDGEVFFSGSFGPGIAGHFESRPFKGAPTERGKAEGVIFHLTWRDDNRDLHERGVTFAPEAIRAGRDEALDEAHQKGVGHGRQLAADEAAARVPLPAPRWDVDVLNWYPQANPHHVLAEVELHNRMPESVATRVRIETGQVEARVTSSAYWADLSGLTTEKFVVSINGTSTDGTPLIIEWHDENSEKQERTVWMDPFFDVRSLP